MEKKIFITGAAGFIGSELVRHLGDVVEYTHKDGCDILDYGHLKSKMKGCDVVVHLAAIRKPLEDKKFDDYFDVNCIGTQNVARAALENGVKRLVFASSVSYYGIEKGMPIEKKIKETGTILTQRVSTEQLKETRDCDIAYSTSKVIAEQILANYGMSKKMEVIILRLGPTRPRGVYKPFGVLNLHLKIENALQVIEKSINSEKQMWYEAFTIVDDIEGVDIEKARQMLGYNPV